MSPATASLSFPRHLLGIEGMTRPEIEQLLDLAPQREGDFFRVPQILSD